MDSDRCIACGCVYGSSWGSTSNYCSFDCENGRTPENKLQEANRKIEKLKKLVKELEEKYEPKYLGEHI